jgi:energy-converting hydrogenase Eha subunit B
MISATEIGGIARTLVAAFAAYAAGKNWIDNETAATIGGGVITILVAVLSVMEKRKRKA